MLTDCVCLIHIHNVQQLCALLELSLPEDVNIFYAVDLRGSALIELVVRRKT